MCNICIMNGIHSNWNARGGHLLAELFFDVRFSGFDDFPQGPSLLACAIVRDFTPPLALREMSELFLPLLSESGQEVGCYEVDWSGRDFGATRSALRCLHDGGCVAIFPRAEDGAQARREGLFCPTGVAELARAGRCAIRTCLICGREPHSALKSGRRRPRIGVVSGAEFRPERSLPPRAAQRMLASLLEADFKRLYRQFFRDLIAETIPQSAMGR
jgi:hypothetical protein